MAGKSFGIILGAARIIGIGPGIVILITAIVTATGMPATMSVADAIIAGSSQLGLPERL